MIQKPPDFDPSEYYNINELDEEIDNPMVVEKYQQSSRIARNCLEEIMKKCKAGVSVLSLCKFGDSIILKLCKDSIKDTDKYGIAVPTCVSPGSIVCNFSPGEIHECEKSCVLRDGEDVRIDVGVHVDGYISLVGTTVFLPRSPKFHKKNQNVKNIPTEDDRSRTICAAKRIMDLTMRMMKPGMGNYEIGLLTRKLCEFYNVEFLRGILSHNVCRYCIPGKRVILHRPTEDIQVFDEKFRMNEVYVLDIAVSSNPKNLGRSCERDIRPCLWKREVHDKKMFLKNESSTRVLDHIDKNYDNFYFPMRKINEIKGNIGFIELKQKGLVSALPVLHGRKNECFVRLIATVAITDEAVVPFCTSILPMNYMKDKLNLRDQKIINILKTTLSFDSRVEENIPSIDTKNE